MVIELRLQAIDDLIAKIEKKEQKPFANQI